jgi:hypothetical protein
LELSQTVFQSLISGFQLLLHSNLIFQLALDFKNSLVKFSLKLGFKAFVFRG